MVTPAINVFKLSLYKKENFVGQGGLAHDITYGCLSGSWLYDGIDA